VLGGRRVAMVTRLAAFWFLLLIVGSLQPARPHAIAGLHRGIHLLAFGVGAFLLFSLSRTWRQQALSALATCSLGLLLEYLQHMIYRNPMEWWDVRDDTFAVVLAFLVMHIALMFRSRTSE